MFLCSHVYIVLFLVLLPCFPSAYTSSSRSQSRTPVVATGSLLPFSYCEWLLQEAQAAVWCTVLTTLHPSPVDTFKGRAYFSVFPHPLPALCAKCALFLLCFCHNFSTSSPGQPFTCCWVGCSCYTAGFYLLLRHRWNRWWGHIRLFGGGRLPVPAQVSQDWLLPMVVSQVLRVLQYAEE